MLSLIEDVLKASLHELSFKNKTALVTGASAGIGLATSVFLAKEGVNLILVARRLERLEQLKNELSNEFPLIEIKIIALDLLDKDAVSVLRQNNAFAVDIFINNAGLSRGRDFAMDMSEEDIDEVVDTNVKSAFKLSSAAAKNMVQKGCGHIVHLGSIAGHHTYEGGSVYCASKFAVRAFSETLRQELHDKNVRVSLVSPGIVKTDFSLVRFKGDKQKADSVYADMECLQASDVARVIVKILSEPGHVNIDEVVVLPTVQAPVSNKVKRLLS